MLHTESNWQTKDGVSVFARTWKPDGNSKAVVILIHGLGEHSGRYQHVASYFTSRGYAISTMDLRGHGRSPGLRGHFPSFDVIKNRHPPVARPHPGGIPGQTNIFVWAQPGWSLDPLFYPDRKSPSLRSHRNSPWHCDRRAGSHGHIGDCKSIQCTGPALYHEKWTRFWTACLMTRL